MTVNHIFISPYEDKPITFCPRLSLISSVFFSSVLSPHPPRLCCMADALCKLPDVQGSLCWTAGHYYEGQTHAHTSKPVLTHTDVTLCSRWADQLLGRMCSHVFCTERKLRSERIIFPPLCRAALNRFTAVSRKLYVYLTDTSHASRSVTCDSDLYIGSTVASNSLSATSWQTLNFTHTVYVKKMSRFLVRVSEVKKKNKIKVQEVFWCLPLLFDKKDVVEEMLGSRKVFAIKCSGLFML